MITWIWNPTFFIALGGVISLAGTIWATRAQANSENTSRERVEKTLAFLMGSHTFTFDHQVTKLDGKDILTLFIKNTGEYPCYELTFQAIDINDHGFEETQNMAELKKPSPIYEKHWNDLPPGTSSQALSLALAEGKNEHNFKVFMNSRKGQNNLKIKFIKTPNRKLESDA